MKGMKKVSVKIITNGATLTAYLDGEIDHHNAACIRERIDEAIETSHPKLLVIDFKEVNFMDSSGVGLVMGRYKNAARYEAEVEIHHLSRLYERIMKMSGLEKFIKILNTKQN